MKKKSAKKSTKSKTVKRPTKRKVNKSRKRKNPTKHLTDKKLLELANRPNVDTARVIEFLNSPFVRTNHRETVLEFLKEIAKFYNLNLDTVIAIREGIDLLTNYNGRSERIFDFNYNYDGYGKSDDRHVGYLNELVGTGTTYPRLSRRPKNWY